MKTLVRLLSLLLLVSLLLSFAGCSFLLSFFEAPSAPPVNFEPTVYTEVIKTAFEASYGDQLSPNEKCIYDAVIALSPGEDQVSIVFPEIPALCAGREPTEAETDALGKKIGYWVANALYAMWLDCPENFWIEHNKYSYSYEMKSDENGIVKLTKLTLDLSLTKPKEEILSDLAKLTAATKDFSVKGKTAADKVAYINNYLSTRIEYDLDAKNRSSVIGALVDRKCVCEGYARAFAYLCRKAGIDAVNIPGYGKTEEKTEGHMWNGVSIDGVFYAVDVTWNDTTKKNTYLLVGSTTLCGKSTFGESHTPDMLTLDGPHKAFALPSISEYAYGTEPQKDN